MEIISRTENNSAILAALSEQHQQFKQIKEKLVQENEELGFQIEAEKNNTESIEKRIQETSQKIDRVKEEKHKTELDLKLEELKQKACSDETIKLMDILTTEIEFETDIYRQKNKLYLEEHGIDIKLNKESSSLNITFLNNGQEIMLRMDKNTKKFNASYEKLSEEVIETGKKEETIKLLAQLNERKINLKQLVLNFRELFFN